MPRVNKRFTVKKRRAREGKTNYHRRLELLKSGKNRVVVRRSANNITAQLVKYEPTGDRVLASASTQELRKQGWSFKSNLPTAYLVGYMLAKKAQAQKATDEAIVDLGSFIPLGGSRLFAVVKGCVEGGLNVRHSPEVFPSDERCRGEHIAAYAKDAAKNQFSKLKSQKVDVAKVPELFDKTKAALDAVK